MRTFYGYEQGIPIVTSEPSLRLPIPGNTSSQLSITDVTHPEYDSNLLDWNEWRLTYAAGTDFVTEYLEKFSRRESPIDFKVRKAITPIPAFAAAAIEDVKNSIFQRAIDITRTGGPKSYVESCNGRTGGVDRRGATMNFFIGDRVIAELLTMKRVGVFVDMPENVGTTQKEQQNKHPYIYVYKAEQIRSWSYLDEGDGREFASVLLESSVFRTDPRTKLPSGYKKQYRHLFVADNGFVVEDKYNERGMKFKTIETQLKKIPFVLLEINQSLLKNIARHQIALLNLGSSDVNWIMKAGFPFYTEQFDPKSANSHLKRSTQVCNDPDIQLEGTSCPSGVDDNPADEEFEAGVAHGRRYPKGMDRPEFIAPPTEPLEASMKKQEALRDEIRLLINLNLSSVQPKMASAESKGFDLQGLEAGLSYIGLELENGERKIAEFWAEYENSREIPTVIYPKRYSLTSEEDQQKEVKHLVEIRKTVISITAKREITKRIASLTVGNTVSESTLQAIYKEIDKAKIIPDDSGTMLEHMKANALSLETFIDAAGYPPEEKEKAAADAKVRLERVQAAQAPRAKLPVNPAARGLPPEVDPDPDSGRREKQGKPKRGQGR